MIRRTAWPHCQSIHPARRSFSWAIAAAAVALLSVDAVSAFTWPWRRDHPWPSSSNEPVVPLDHPVAETTYARLQRETGELPVRYGVAVYGDQRALADGEWQDMIDRIAHLESEESSLDFIVDTGDIVHNGTHADQFRFLAKILRPVSHIPYLVAVGNHENHNNRSRIARENTATFLHNVAPGLSAERLYYRKDLGSATFLFLDSNDWIYGADGSRRECPGDVPPGSREAEQVEWLRAQLRIGSPDDLRIVVMHHPMIQSSHKHKRAARSLWNFRPGGESLADIMAGGGVDVVLAGHTHTYEWFRLTRHDGREIDLVNLSGRPRDSFLWAGAGDRRARDLRGQESEWLSEQGWSGLDSWRIVQEEFMPEEDEANQFAVLTVEPDGRLFMNLHFLDGDAPGGTRRADTVQLN